MRATYTEVTDEYALGLKIKKLEEKAKSIKVKLTRCYNYELFRELSIINHKIEVTTRRIDGTFNQSIETISITQL